jgi:hypothetical protein
MPHSAPLTLQVWAVDEYLTGADNGPESLIRLEDIACHVVRSNVVIRGQHYWATMMAGKVCSQLARKC